MYIIDTIMYMKIKLIIIIIIIITIIIITISMITIIIIIIIIIMIIFNRWLFVDMEFFSMNVPRENPDLCLCMYSSLCKQQK